MSIRQLSQLKEAHNSLQKQYNQLLTKNQNDLIAIRKKEKAMNAIIQQLKQQKEKLRQQMQNQINTLQIKLQQQNKSSKQNGKNNITKNSSSTVSSALTITPYKNPQSDTIKQLLTLKQQIKKLTFQKEKLIRESDCFKNDSDKQIKQLSRDNHFKQQKIQNLQRQIQVKKQQAKKQQTDIQKLNDRISEFEQSAKKPNQLDFQTGKLQQIQQNFFQITRKNQQMQQKLYAYQKNISMLQKEIAQKKQQLSQMSNKKCVQCIHIRQQLELQKQILKSSQIMLRAKQMELQRIKNSSSK